MTKGVFITFEGGEGAGKTTLMKELAEHWQNKGYHVLQTREPGGIEIAEKIRTLILDPAHTEMEARTEALLYAAARRQHLVEKVIPALTRGEVVFCDRFIDSSLAYQGWARGIGMDEVMAMNQFAIDTYMPDATIYLDLPPEVGLRRIEKNQGREVNRLDMEKLSFHEDVRSAYLKLVERYPHRIRKVDANRSKGQVFSNVESLLLPILKEGKAKG